MSSISILLFLTQTVLNIRRISIPLLWSISEVYIVNLKKSSPSFLMKDDLRATKISKKGFLFGYNPIVIDLGGSLRINTLLIPFFANNQKDKLYKIDASYIEIYENQIQHSILFLPLGLLYFYQSFFLEIRAEGRTKDFKLSKEWYS